MAILIFAGCVAWLIVGALTLRLCMQLTSSHTIQEFMSTHGSEGTPLPAIPPLIVLLWPLVIATLLLYFPVNFVVKTVKWIAEFDGRDFRAKRRTKAIERDLSRRADDD